MTIRCHGSRGRACAIAAAICGVSVGAAVAGHVSGRRTRSDDVVGGTHDTAMSMSDLSDFMRLEYISLREESAQARTSQQSILQWSLAAFAAVFGAGLLFVSGHTGRHGLTSPSLATFLLVFGIALPFLSSFACLAWFGELRRMERAGSYLRGLEIALAESVEADRALPLNPGPLRWETFLHQGAPRRKERRLSDGRVVQQPAESMVAASAFRWPRRPGEWASQKQYVGYIGSVLIYTGVIVISLVMAVGAVYFASATRSVLGHPELDVAAFCTIPVLGLTVMPLAVIGARIVWSGRWVVDYRAIRPARSVVAADTEADTTASPRGRQATRPAREARPAADRAARSTE